MIKSITPKENDGIGIQLRAPGAEKASQTIDCIDYYYEIWSQYCTDWYTRTETVSIYTGTSCGDWFQDGYIYAYTECSDSGGDAGGYYDWGGGGGSPGGSTTSLSSSAAAITLTTHLDNNGIDLYNQALDNLLEQCGYYKMYDYLTGIGAMFTDVYIDPTGSTGGYDYVTGKVSFRDNSSITSGLAEEFVHLFQDNYYPGGMGNYIHNANFEFEAKVIQDLECMMRGMVGGLYGDPNPSSLNYTKWMEVVTNYGTYFPSYGDLLVQYSDCGNLNYSDFLNAFSTNPAKPQYNLPVIPTLTPQAIPYVKNNPCN